MIVDDHEIVRTGLSLLLKSNGYTIAGIVKSGAEVIPFLQTEAVDIILLDLGLPDVHGLTILAELVGVHDASLSTITEASCTLTFTGSPYLPSSSVCMMLR